ncbi:MAG: hypothetical protein JRF33_01470 [Deltaproteobacteria bacterium]|nr:hypothetical protein [Deltaproteobacteria bacterium]
MRFSNVMTCLLASLMVIGCTNGDDLDCIDTGCVQPPANICADADTLRTYDSQGSCDPDTDACVYGHSDIVCDQGCSEGSCDSIDPCAGVVCDEPPDNHCVDALTLRIFETWGVCGQADGICDYGFTDRACTTGCEDARCVGEDLCEGVVCDDPPPARCLDDSTVEEFDSAGTCEASSGRCDYERSERTCPDGCVQGVCLSLGEDYALVIPAGTRVCTDKHSSWDVFGAYQTRMRVTFRDGVVSLPKNEPSFERDWIASVEFGPDRVLLDPLTSGYFTLTSLADRDEYEFVQTFSDGSMAYTLTYKVEFDPSATDDRLRVFDEFYLSPPVTYPTQTIELTVDREEFERWYFLTCRHDLYLPVLHRVQTADGAELLLEERYYPSEDCMFACPTALVRARFQLGQEERLLEDPFRLAFVDGQHNWFDRFLLVFDDPVEDIHALHYFPNDNQAPEKKVDYLDAELNVMRQSLVTSHTIVDLWPTFDSGAVPATNCTEYCRDHVGLAEGCEAFCIVEGQTLAGRCFPTQQWPTTDDWTALATCDEAFDACVGAGRPFIQCCCSRIANF